MQDLKAFSAALAIFGVCVFSIGLGSIFEGVLRVF
jgi:hypothetical protein